MSCIYRDYNDKCEIYNGDVEMRGCDEDGYCNSKSIDDCDHFQKGKRRQTETNLLVKEN